jgi:replicative DNA helicase
MDVERALLTRCLMTGGITTLISRGVDEHHFARNTPDGQENCDVFRWMADHAKTYNSPPSQQLFRERWPEWRAEPCSDPLEALIDAFFAHVKRRAFSAKVLELVRAEADVSRWNDLDAIMLDAARDLAALVPSGRVSRFSDMPQRIEQYEVERANPDLRRGWHMGIRPFDEITGGMRPGNLVTVAGFSGRGKSLLSAILLMQAHEQGAQGLLVSLEMTSEEIFERLDTMVMKFSHKLLAARELPDEKVALWKRIARQFAGAQNDIVVVDRCLGCTTDRVYAELSRYKPDVAVVDYVQLMKSRQSYAAQWQALVDITNELKQIALATDTAIIMVSQDGREAAKDGSTEENMGGSISVYQAADIYLGLHQSEEMYAQQRMEIRLLKNRRGKKMPSAYMRWIPETMDFEYIDPDASEHTSYLRVVK